MCGRMWFKCVIENDDVCAGMAVGTADAAATSNGRGVENMSLARCVREPSLVATSLDATESRTLNWVNAMKPSRFEPVPGKGQGG